MTGPNGAARIGNVLIMHRSHLETAGPPPAQETAGDGGPAGGGPGEARLSWARVPPSHSAQGPTIDSDQKAWARTVWAVVLPLRGPRPGGRKRFVYEAGQPRRKAMRPSSLSWREMGGDCRESLLGHLPQAGIARPRATATLSRL